MKSYAAVAFAFRFFSSSAIAASRSLAAIRSRTSRMTTDSFSVTGGSTSVTAR